MSVYTILACVSIGALTVYLHHRLNRQSSKQQHNTVISTQEYQQQLADILQFREQKQALQKRLNHLLTDEDAKRLLTLEQEWNTTFHTLTLKPLPSPMEEDASLSQPDETKEEVLLHPGLDAHQMAFLRYLINSKKVNEFPENFPKN